MGWASGSSLAAGIIQDLRETAVDEDSRVEIYKVLITNFEDFDCDTMSECLGDDPAFDRARKLLGNEIDEEEDYEDEDYEELD